MVDSTVNKNYLETICKQVLSENDLGKWTRPAKGLYPHQWLWDSAFIAIGLRHVDPERAAEEILNLFKGQWRNGMVPNIIINQESFGDRVWDSSVNPDAPKNVMTSGITQPPMLAEAVWQIGEKLPIGKKQEFFKKAWPHLLKYHEWLYTERDPRGQGLVTLIHPWESGLDNSPPWVSELRRNQMPLWIKLVSKTKIIQLATKLRKDAQYINGDERPSADILLTFYSIARRLKRKKYKTSDILRHNNIAIEDLAFNAILVRANSCLSEIGKSIKTKIPDELFSDMKKTPHSLELLWDDKKSTYFSRNYETYELIEEPSIAHFLPLYAGTISKHRAAMLAEQLQAKIWSPKYGVASAPTNSKYFGARRYWQGPVWINTNWLIIKGLERYGHQDVADKLRQYCLELVEHNGCYEYFSPLDGTGTGARNFSWTAALALDLLKS